MLYKAFISYSHAADDRLAPAVQSALHSFAKPWYRLRAIRVFRDKTSLSVTPALWPSIEKALCESEYFILMASPEAAGSRWVQKEIDYWLKNRSPEKLLIVLTGGELVWDNKINAFSRIKTTSIPENLKNVFKEEPFWLDLRWAKTEEHLSLKHPKFREVTARVASTLHNMPLDEISGEEVRQHRKTMRVAWSAVILLLILAIAASIGAYVAEMRRREAERQRFISISQALAAYAPREQEQGKNDELAALLGLQAYIFNNRYHSDRKDYVDKALRQVLSTPYFSIRLSGGKNKPMLTSAAISRDSKFLAVGGHDMKVRIWKLNKRKEPPVILNQSYGIIWSLAFSPSSNFLSAGTEDGYVLLWKYSNTGETDSVRILNNHGNRRVTSIEISKDGELLASGSVDGMVRIWDLKNVEVAPLVLYNNGQNKPVRSLAFHPMLRHIIASGGDDKTVRIWDLNRPEVPYRVIQGHDNAVKSVAFSINGLMIASGTDRSFLVPSVRETMAYMAENSELQIKQIGGNIFLWDLQKDKDVPTILRGHKEAVTSLSFSPNGEYLASAGGGDRTIRLWNLNRLDKSSTLLRGHEGYIATVVFSPDGRFLASVCSNESSVRLWDMGRPLGRPITLSGHKGAIRSLSFSPDGNFLISAGGEDGTVRMWDLTQPGKKPTRFDHEGFAVAVTYNPNGQMFATGCYGGVLDYENQIRLWDPYEPQKSKCVLSGHKSSVICLAFNNNGKLLASAGRLDREIWLWNFDKIDTPKTVLSSLPVNVSSLALGRNSQILAWGGDDGLIRVLNRYHPDTDPAVLGGHKKSVSSVAFTPDDRLLASGSDDGTVLLWDLRHIEKEPVVLEKHEGNVNSIAIDSAGIFLASGSSDGKVRLQNLQYIGSDALVFSEHKSDIFAVALSPEGRWIAAGGGDKTVVVWPGTKVLADLVCKKVWRNLTQDEWDRFIGQDIPYEWTCPNLPPGENTKANR